MGRKPTIKQRSRNEDKREKWIYICMDYFSENGLENVTMDDVANLLNISKATIYNHFKSKDEMVMAAIAIKLKEIQVYEEYFNDQELPFLERYYKAIRYYAEINMNVSPKLAQDVRLSYPELWAHVIMFRNHFNFVVEKYYQEGIDKGIFYSGLNIKMLVLTDRWFLEALVEQNFLAQNNLSLDEAFESFFKMKFDGIVQSKLTHLPLFNK